MTSFDELEFIQRMSLRDVKKMSKGLNFKCDVCHDKKRRAYILFDNGTRGHNTVYCHNCGLSTNIRQFLEINDTPLYMEYIDKNKQDFIDNLRNGTTCAKKRIALPSAVVSEPTKTTSCLKTEKDLKYLFRLSTRYFVPASQSKDCVSYAQERKIPDHVFQTLKYCIHPNKMYSGMLIFPFYFDADRVYGFQGRSITDKMFYNHSPNNSFKVYNIFNVDLLQDVFIFESIIDSYHKKNSISMCGSDLSVPVQQMLKLPVYVFDNDRTGHQKAIKYAEFGYRVMVWPRDISTKDPNDLARKCNWSDERIENLIIDNVKSGVAAITAIKFNLGGRKR